MNWRMDFATGKKLQKLRLKWKCIYFFFKSIWLSKKVIFFPSHEWVNFDTIFIIYVQVIPQECEACNEDI